MSSFNSSKPQEHTIFYGTSENAQTTFTDTSTQLIYAPLWDEHTEKEYMERVKAKAKQEARTILEKAFLDAEHIRKKAHQEGYNEGAVEARQALEKTAIQYVRYFESILQAMEEYSQTLYQNMEEDITSLIQTAVEQITSITLQEQSKEVIKQALLEAVRLVAMDKEFIISINPDDYQSVLDVIHTLYDVYPASKHWHVKKNADIPLGSCQFEDDINVISVNRQKRKEKVMEILTTIQFNKT